MCGICGYIRFSDEVPDPAPVLRVRDRMTSRGPDDAGLWQGPGAVLGHRRLSIIDLSPAGHQPMSTPDGALWVVFNGEIYNFADLRAELETKGYAFVSKTDTEVLLHGYREWGETLPDHLEGMFALALWDAQDRCLFLARDRMGKKPLFYWQQGQEFWFASSLGALEPELPALTIDWRALDHFLRYRYVPDHLCIYREVQRVPPAASVSVRAGETRSRVYWQPSFTTDRKPGFHEAVEQVEEALEQAVACRLIADVPIGIFLSGGVDSSTIAAFSVRHNAAIKAYHILTSHENREDAYARRVADHLGIDLEICEAGEVTGWDRVAEVHGWFGEPFADPAATTSALVSKIARSHITVALSGDGGDEVFAGYPEPLREMRGQRVRRWIGTRPAARLAALANRLPVPLAGTAAHFLEEAGRSPVDRRARRDPLAREAAVYSPEAALASWEAGAYFADRYADFETLSPVQRALYADRRTRLVGEFLAKVDVTAMAHSLEVRNPFLDRKVVELAMSLPANYLVTPFETKHLLKTLMARLVPHAALHRPKQGFQLPVGQMLRGEWHTPARTLLLEERDLLTRWFSEEFVQRMTYQDTWQNPAQLDLVWRVVCLTLWARTVKHRLV